LTVPLIETQCEDHKGKWKDGLCSCFRLGIFHPTHCNAWLCPQVLLGQLLTRMKMNWLAAPSSQSSFQSTFRKIIALLVVFSVYDIFMAPPLFEVNVDHKGELSFSHNSYPCWHQVCYVLLSLPMTVFGFVVVVKLRAAIRTKYGIPTGRLGRLEDFICVCCCNCCVFAQMARQTADYEQEPAACCSPNGMRHKVVATEETRSLV
jgi:Cys-rich protein (TIGR01571 family)